MRQRPLDSCRPPGVARLDEANIPAQRPTELRREAWRIADQLGWPRTYDAEYLALAHLLRCRLMTIDDRLRRGAGHIVEMIGPLDE